MGWIILSRSVRGKRIRCTIVEMNLKIRKKFNKMFGNEFGIVPGSLLLVLEKFLVVPIKFIFMQLLYEIAHALKLRSIENTIRGIMQLNAHACACARHNIYR